MRRWKTDASSNEGNSLKAMPACFNLAVETTTVAVGEIAKRSWHMRKAICNPLSRHMNICITRGSRRRASLRKSRLLATVRK